jgi:hypothetical protein
MPQRDPNQLGQLEPTAALSSDSRLINRMPAVYGSRQHSCTWLQGDVCRSRKLRQMDLSLPDNYNRPSSFEGESEN